MRTKLLLLLSVLLVVAVFSASIPITVFAVEPPTLLSAAVTSNGGVGLTFSKEISPTDLANKVKAGFTIIGIEDTPKTITNVTLHSASGGTNNFIQLYLSPTIKGGEAAGLEYAPGGVQSLDGGVLAAIASMDIENYAPHPDLVTVAPPAATVGTPYSHTLTAVGGTGPYTYSVDGGYLPSGLTMSETGVISGTPTIAASFTFYILVQDANQAIDIKGFNITVNPSVQKVCEINGTQYFTLDAALASIPAGGTSTVKLLCNIEHNAGVYIDGKKVTFDLNGYTLNIVNPAENGFGLAVQQGGAVYLTGSGALNATGAAYGVRVSTNFLYTQATVTNATATATNGEAAYAAGPAKLTVLKDASVTGINAIGAHTISKGVIDIKGNVNASNQGVYASDSTITVDGNVVANGTDILGGATGIGVGVYGRVGSVKIGGNVTANRVGATVRAGGSITIDGMISAPAYIQFGDDEPTTIENFITPTTKEGYRTYQHSFSGTVWMLGEMPITTYALTVTNGTGSGSYAKDAVITITANPAPSGQRFKEWNITPSVTFTENTSKNNETAKFIMPAQTVTVTAVYEVINYTITVQNDGNGTASANFTSAAEGAEITLSATPNTGYRFKEWQVISGGVTVVNNKFNILDMNVTVKAIFEQIPTYTVTVTGGTGSGSYAKDAVIAITANPAPSGQRFKEWSITPSVTFTENTSKNNETAKFVMPAQTVTVTAVYEAINYTITVQNDGNGTANANFTSAAEGAEITLSATPNTGYRFKEWQVISGGVTVVNNKFNILDMNVTVKAIFEPIPTYTVTVTGGTGSGNFTEGAVVIITANPAPEGKVFDKWTSADGVTFENESAASTSFTMPAKAVIITAIYKDLPPVLYTINVQNDGNGTATAAPVSAEAGTEITLTATANEGYRFKTWEVVNGDVLINNNKFIMPASSVTIKAIFEIIPTEDYQIIKGIDGSWKLGTDSGMEIICNGDFAKFLYVKVDGTLLASDKYTAASGSTIITLKPEYLSTLTPGEHIVEIFYTDGSVRTGLTIQSAETDESGEIPITGDNSNISLLFTLMMLSCATIVCIILYSKKKRVFKY